MLNQNKNPINAYRDLKGKKLGLVSGYNYFKLIRNDSVLDKVFFNRDEALIKQLMKGHIDVIIMNEDVGDYLIKKTGNANLIKKQDYKVVEKDGSDSRLGFSKDERGEALQKHFDGYLNSIHKLKF